MTRHRSRRRRSLAEWRARGAIAIAIAMVGYVSVAATIGYADRATAPDLAYRLAPWDGRITAELASKLSGVEGNAADLPRAQQLARKALRQDPTAIRAVVALGLVDDQLGRGRAAARLFDYANVLSRRDLATQLWEIETAVARGDVTGTLRHYDIALRTSRHASDLLFPVLVSALADPAIRTALVRTLIGRPMWGPLFLEYAASSSPNPHITSLLFQELHRKGVEIAPVAQTVLIDTLASRGAFDDAWIYYQVVHPNSDRKRSRDPRFSASLAMPTVFDWRIVNDSAINSSVQRTGDGGLIDFAAPFGVGGAVVQQAQFLPPGRYRLSGSATKLASLGSDSPYWVVKCQEGQELQRIDVPGTGDFAGIFDVSTQCKAQTLTLVLRPTDAPNGVSGQITRSAVTPVASNAAIGNQAR